MRHHATGPAPIGHAEENNEFAVEQISGAVRRVEGGHRRRDLPRTRRWDAVVGVVIAFAGA
jgi:hypothetical protein